MRLPDTQAPALALCGVMAVVVGEIIFRVTIHDIHLHDIHLHDIHLHDIHLHDIHLHDGCSAVSAYSPWAPWLVAVGAVLCTAGFIRTFLRVGSLPAERPSWRRATLVVSRPGSRAILGVYTAKIARGSA